jgi:hypothetical protein
MIDITVSDINLQDGPVKNGRDLIGNHHWPKLLVDNSRREAAETLSTPDALTTVVDFRPALSLYMFLCLRSYLLIP